MDGEANFLPVKKEEEDGSDGEEKVSEGRRERVAVVAVAVIAIEEKEWQSDGFQDKCLGLLPTAMILLCYDFIW